MTMPADAPVLRMVASAPHGLDVDGYVIAEAIMRSQPVGTEARRRLSAQITAFKDAAAVTSRPSK